MTSADLTRSATWEHLGARIGAQFRAGVPFADILEMNIAIKQRDLDPYRAHRARLDASVWPDDAGPKTIIDLGAGYGAMATFWPDGASVFNVDLPEMLDVQEAYLRELGCVEVSEGTRVFGRGQLAEGVLIALVPFTEADRLPWDGAYLFTAWALTETTPATWAYYISKVPRLAGAYIVGHVSWEGGDQWPWDRLSMAFKASRFESVQHGIELIGVNR